MKIRTRLLLSLLPAFASGVLFIAIILCYSLQQLFLVVSGIALLIVLTAVSVYFIAGKISKPIQKLNNSALAIAAGRYGESIQVSGPKELKELANTLNTMSECLLENINRLKENSSLKERLAQEAEALRLLQHLLLQKNVDDCRSDAIAVKAISFSTEIPRAILLDFPKMQDAGQIALHLAEAKDEGFEGLYELLTHYRLPEKQNEEIPFSSLRLSLDLETGSLNAAASGFPMPLLWSVARQEFVEVKSAKQVEAGDFVFLLNRGCYSLFKGSSKIVELLAKVLRHFAEEGLEISAQMLRKELSHAIKRKDPEDDLHLICLQILKLP